MSRTSTVMKCRPEDVFAVLSDGWLYGMWVVGSARIRKVDPDWPQPASKLYHSVGVWPLLVSDTSEVERVDAPHLLQLKVRAWPAGEARVVLTCTPRGEGETEVVLEEYPVNGPATLIPQPLEAAILRLRNDEALRRLANLSEGRARS